MLRKLAGGLRALLRRDARNAEIQEELRAFVESSIVTITLVWHIRSTDMLHPGRSAFTLHVRGWQIGKPRGQNQDGDHQQSFDAQPSLNQIQAA